MKNKECPYAVFNQKGLTQWLTCSKSNNQMCGFQRRCSELNKVINSNGAEFCKLRMEEDK